MKRLALAFWVLMISILGCGLAIYFQPYRTTQSAGLVSPVVNLAPAMPLPTPVPSGASAVAIPGPPPAVTPIWRYPRNTRIGGINVGSLTETQAQQVLERESAALLRPLQLLAADQLYVVKATDIALQLPIDQQLAEARQQAERSTGSIQVPFKIVYDATKLRSLIEALAVEVAISPTLGFDSPSSTFILTPGLTLNVTESLDLVVDQLGVASQSRRIKLATTPITNSLQASSEQVIAALADREDQWGGLLGVAIYNLDTDQLITYRGDTVFSGVSVLKIPILLQAYISRAEFTEEQHTAIDLMMRISDNESANELLAMIGQGDGLEGVQRMNTMLQDVLGLRYTSLAAPFESITYLNKFLDIQIPERGQEGPAPYTDADPYVRATPREMTRIVTAIAQCANGTGPLLDMAGTHLTAERCHELLDVMQRNEDINKIVAGVPADTYVAHKSGWIDDVRADAGLVRPLDGHEYAISMWMWEDTDYILTEVSDPLLADISRIVYTAFHPQLTQPAK